MFVIPNSASISQRFLSDNWYTVMDLMKMFERSKTTINRWRRELNLIFTKIKGTTAVNESDLARFMIAHRRVSNGKGYLPVGLEQGK